MPEPTTPASQAADPNAELTPEQAQAAWLEEANARSNPDAAPPAVAAPAPAAAVDEPPPPEVPDELARALQDVASLKDLVTQLHHTVRSSEGRVGAMQRELQEARAAAQRVQAPAPNEQTARAAAKDPEKWAKLKEDFPEWGEAVEALVDSRQAPAAPQVDFAPIEERISGLTTQFQRAIEEAKVFGAHRDWKNVINTPEFVTWHRAQDPQIQALAASAHGEDAITMIDKFKADRQVASDATRNTTAERAARLAAAAAPARKPTAPPPKGDSELTPAELWAQEAAQREQSRAQRR